MPEHRRVPPETNPARDSGVKNMSVANITWQDGSRVWEFDMAHSGIDSQYSKFNRAME